MKRIASVGVDVGGTWMRAAFVDHRGKLIRLVKVPAPSPGLLPGRLETLFRTTATVPEVLTVGSKGVWTHFERANLLRRLKRLARQVNVISDVELAFESALTPLDERPGHTPGVLILAGTGSIALGRDRFGRMARAGGLGSPGGDPGSGFWIGTRYLEMLGRHVAYSGSRRVAQVAGLSREVIRRARKDHECRAIIHKAQAELAWLVWSVANRLRMKGVVPLSWAGGLLENRSFRTGVLKLLSMAKEPFRFRPVAPTQLPAIAAARWGHFLNSGRTLRRRPARGG